MVAENEAVVNNSSATIYSRAEHPVSRSQISHNALKVLYRLNESGYEAYLVGGCVRDLLLGREPKDFDVATSATPEQVKAVFRNCRLIGRRFRLAHVFFGREIIEVATFRGSVDVSQGEQKTDGNGRVLRDNSYGSIEEDAWRRDFTVNALYYTVTDFSVVDYTNGMEDHRAGVLRLIGDAEQRYREDPVRMIRAVRFAVKLGFSLHINCEQPIHDMAHLLGDIPAARLYDEFLKLFLSGYGLQTFEMLRHYGLFAQLFPATDVFLSLEEEHFPKLFIIKALENSDKRIAEGKSITPYFLLAAFLWESVQTVAQQKLEQGLEESIAYQEAGSQVISKQIRSIAFPKRVGLAMREVWQLQGRFKRRKGSKPSKLLGHPRFRAAYDFLVLRAETGGADKDLVEWWTKFQFASESEQRRMTQPRRHLKKNKNPEESS